MEEYISVIVQILGVGIIGFGFTLAVLSYRLIKVEQDGGASNPRISHYMFFSIALVLLGIVSVPINQIFGKDAVRFDEFKSGLPISYQQLSDAEVRGKINKLVFNESHCENLENNYYEKLNNMHISLNKVEELALSKELVHYNKISQFFLSSYHLIKVVSNYDDKSIDPTYLPEKKEAEIKHIIYIFKSIGLNLGSFKSLINNPNRVKEKITKFKVENNLEENYVIDNKVIAIIAMKYIQALDSNDNMNYSLKLNCNFEY